MKSARHPSLFVALGATALAVTAFGVNAAPSTTFDWQVVVNNGFEIPDNPGRFYNSYNPPSVNANALLVFRARSTGQQQGPVSGIYTRDMVTLAAINKIADRDTEVPWPNNTCYPISGPGEEEEDPIGVAPCDEGDTLSTYNEFPSFPRIALTADAVATRGNHPPVWTYEVDEGGVVTETRAGTTGVYVNLNANNTTSPLITGASLLGAVPAFSDSFAETAAMMSMASRRSSAVISQGSLGKQQVARQRAGRATLLAVCPGVFFSATRCLTTRAQTRSCQPRGRALASNTAAPRSVRRRLISARVLASVPKLERYSLVPGTPARVLRFQRSAGATAPVAESAWSQASPAPSATLR